jgi:hypothetical protein
LPPIRKTQSLGPRKRMSLEEAWFKPENGSIAAGLMKPGSFIPHSTTLSHNDSRFPIPGQELRQELTKLEFSSYPVIHEHKLGSCRGRLRINGLRRFLRALGGFCGGFHREAKERQPG